MALNSSSTAADAKAQYNDNLNWEDSVASARDAIAAVRWMIGNRGKIIESGTTKAEFESLAGLEARINTFLNARDSSTRRRTSFVRGKARPQ